MTASLFGDIRDAVLVWLGQRGISFWETALIWTQAQFAIILAAFAWNAPHEVVHPLG